MKSDKLKLRIENLESEVSGFRSRRESLQKKVDKLTDGVASGLANAKGRKKQESLQADIHTLDGTIKQVQKAIDQCREQLDKALAAEERQEMVEELVRIAGEAGKIMETYYDLYLLLDRNLETAISRLINIRKNWRSLSGDFDSLIRKAGISPQELEDQGVNMDGVLHKKFHEGPEARGSRSWPESEAVFARFIRTMIAERSNPSSIMQKKIGKAG